MRGVQREILEERLLELLDEDGWLNKHDRMGLAFRLAKSLTDEYTILEKVLDPKGKLTTE